MIRFWLWHYAAVPALLISAPLFAETIDFAHDVIPQHVTDESSRQASSPAALSGGAPVADKDLKSNNTHLKSETEDDTLYERARNNTGLKSLGNHLYLFGGNAQIGDTSVTATEGCFICWNNTVTKRVNNWSGSTAGIHLEEWFNQSGSPLLLGIAGELSHTIADAPGVEVSYDTIGITPQLGYSFYNPGESDRRTLRAYLGFNILVIIQADASVNFPEFTQKVSPPVSGSGTGFILGASVSYRRFDMLIELRSITMSISSDVDLNLSGDAIDVTLDSTQVVVGVGYKIK